jgi:predicted transporter
MIPIRFHIPLTCLAFFGGFAVMFFFTPLLSVWGALLEVIKARVPESWGVVRNLLGLLVAIGALVVCNLPCLLFLALVPVRCPREGCGGVVRVTRSSPITYTCSACGMTHITRLNIGRR